MLTQFFNLIETSDELRIITRDDLIYFILVDKQRVFLIVKHRGFGRALLRLIVHRSLNM